MDTLRLLPSLFNLSFSQQKQKDEKEKKAEKFKGGKVILFVAGGITYSEMRVAYELSEHFNREVIVGGSEILLPKPYVEAIRSLRTQLNENEDE